MKGIQYITDESGKKSAVVIDLNTYGEQIEDFIDGLEALQRVYEPGEDYKKVMDRILQSKKADEWISHINQEIGRERNSCFALTFDTFLVPSLRWAEISAKATKRKKT